MIYCFDLDDTICYPNHEAKDTFEKYGKALPCPEIIEHIKYLKKVSVENTIIIYTARRMVTHDGDLQKIKEDVQEITENWLREFDVPHDSLIFGKPFADVYIDDKALNVDIIKERLKERIC